MHTMVERPTHGWVHRPTKRNQFFHLKFILSAGRYSITTKGVDHRRMLLFWTLLLVFQDVSGSARRHHHVPRHTRCPPAQDKGNGGSHDGLEQAEGPSHIMPPHSHETLNTMLAPGPCTPTCVPTPPDNFDTRKHSLFR